MKMRLSALAALSLMLLGTTAAHAVQRNCPSGQVWDPNQGSCVKKAKVKRLSPAEKYYQAIEKLEGAAGVAPDPARAADLLRQACDAKEATACTLMGHVLLVGKSAPDPRHAVVADAKQSLRFFDRACLGGDAQGCLGVADVHARGLLGKVDQISATTALAKACEMENGRGCYRLGEQYERGLGVKTDAKRANELYKKAYALLAASCPGNGPSCYQLGVAYMRGNGTAVNREKGYAAFEAGCSGGSGEACFEQGKALFWGTGVKMDKARSVEFYERSCTQYDFALGCHDAGVTLVMGDVTVDKPRGHKLAVRACELDKRECELLAYLIANDPDPKRDETAASEWYRIACESGNATGCFSLGWRTSTGTGIAKDMARAQAAYERACDSGYGPACRRLGYAYYNGESINLVVTTDKKKGFQFFARACDGGDAESCHWAGYMAERGEGMAVNEELAVLAYSHGCKLKRGASCDALAKLNLAGKGGLAKDAKKAQELWEQGCDIGDVDVCLALGHRYYDGDGLDKDDAAAAGAFERACKLGATRECFWVAQLLQSAGDKVDAARKEAAVKSLSGACKAAKPNLKACLALAGILAYGTIADKDPRAAFALVKTSCEGGKDQDACVELANYYMNGIGVVPNVEEGKRRYQEQCDANMASSCTWLGLQLYKEEKFEIAAQLFARSCTDKHGQACTMIGFAHYAGKGVRWDVEAAAKEYEQGCDLGEAVACSNLAEIYEIGYAREKDLKKALALYEKACTPNATSGCWAIGRFYEAGLGGAKSDLARAEREYRRACDADTGEACHSLAKLLGRGGKSRPQEIAKLNARAFELATQQGVTNPYGLFVLGKMYRDGITVMKNAAKAGELFQRSCHGNEPQGCMAGGALAMERGRAGDKSGFEEAAVFFDKSCAAGMSDACDGAAEARKLGQGPVNPSPSPPLPGKLGPKAGGCGCEAGGRGAAGNSALLLALVLALAALGRRARRSSR